jgi:hypothetical protein
VSMRDVDAVLERLRSPEPDARKRAATLESLERNPTGDPRVLAEIERLLDDTAVTIIQIPLKYAEVRFMAAEALAAERGRAGIRGVVHFDQIAWPLTPQKIADATRAAGLPFGGGGVEGDLERFRSLREAGKLPTRPYDRPHPWHEVKEQVVAAVRGAVEASRQGRAVEQTCIFCGGVLHVMPVPPDQPTQWLVGCPCGQSNTTIKGL